MGKAFLYGKSGGGGGKELSIYNTTEVNAFAMHDIVSGDMVCVKDGWDSADNYEFYGNMKQDYYLEAQTFGMPNTSECSLS